MLVRSQEEDQDVGEQKGEERFLIQARMCVDKEVIELKRFHQGPKTISEQVDLIAFTQHARDLSGLDAGRDEIELASVCCCRVKRCRYIVCRLLNAATPIEVVVEGQPGCLSIHAKEDMQSGRLDISIDHSGAFALLGDTTRQIGDEIGFACSTPVRVNGNDRRHEKLDSFLLVA